jgi:DNA-binding MarR family transcriptional regulator
MGPKGNGLVETEQLAGKRMAAAITEKGRDLVRPIMERYNNLAENLMAGLSEEDRKAHLQVNKAISNSTRPRLEDLGFSKK